MVVFEYRPVAKFLELENASDEKGWRVDVANGNGSGNGCAGLRGGSRRTTWSLGTGRLTYGYTVER